MTGKAFNHSQPLPSPAQLCPVAEVSACVCDLKVAYNVEKNKPALGAKISVPDV